ncbi:MAG: mechanosensitive ion channel family protein [Clostridia bacterium]|nr:mechanosensitive ion channel family protein [Clostridia bacterium]
MNFTDISSRMHGFFGDLYLPVLFAAKIIGILIISISVVKLGSVLIRKMFEKQKSFKYLETKRLDTMSTLLVSVFRYGVYVIAAVIILSDVFDLKSVLAAAGIGGIALGFGAQSLIRDVISGFFIILEDQYVVGDLITIDGLTGTVEEMELRITRLRNMNGDLYIIPNGEIKKVINHTRGNKAVIVDIPVAYSADVNMVFQLAERVCADMDGKYDKIVEQPKVLGITELGKESMNLRIFAKTLPNEQWEIERIIRLKIKEEFEKNNVEFFEKNKIIKYEGGSATGGCNG